MKKLTSLFLIICLLLTSSLLLTSCFHECEFTDEWAVDENSHWHACSDEKCEEIADKADHTWDEGKITTKATQESAGVKTYTCSVCAHTKTEAVAFAGLDEEDWNAALSAEVFTSFTYSEESVVTMTGFEMTTVATYEFTENTATLSMVIAGQSTEETITGQEAKETKEALIKSLQDMLKHGIFEYDAENKIYNLTGTMRIDALDTNAKSATLKFENGKLAEFVYTCDVVSSGIAMECESTVTFSYAETAGN